MGWGVMKLLSNVQTQVISQDSFKSPVALGSPVSISELQNELIKGICKPAHRRLFSLE